MNNKKCRKIRQTIRQQVKDSHNIDLKEIFAKYDITEVKTPCIIIEDGKEVHTHAITHVRTLMKGCPREVYKDYKRKLKTLGY